MVIVWVMILWNNRVLNEINIRELSVVKLF